MSALCRHPASLAFLLASSLLLSQGCDPPTSTEDGGPRADAGGSPPVECAAFVERLELGRCVDEAGAACDGAESSSRFEALPPDTPIAPVTGPQGSTMFALALQARGVAPGDPDQPFASENPITEITVLEGETELAHYRGRSGMRATTGDPDLYENAPLYVVVDAPAATLTGRTLEAVATLTDIEGELRCGTLSFRVP